MMNWLKTKGSPHSRIDNAIFSQSNENKYVEFRIKH